LFGLFTYSDNLTLISLNINSLERELSELSEGGLTDDISTLSRWWGLSAPETLRAIPAVA
jgi:hypothetical protein